MWFIRLAKGPTVAFAISQALIVALPGLTLWFLSLFGAVGAAYAFALTYVLLHGHHAGCGARASA